MHSDQEAGLKGETMGEPLVNKGKVDSKVMVGRGNDQMGKEENESDITEEADKAKKAKAH